MTSLTRSVKKFDWKKLVGQVDKFKNIASKAGFGLNLNYHCILPHFELLGQQAQTFHCRQRLGMMEKRL